MSDKILEKIKKLIAHESSARKINSADAFAAKIQNLINEYNFSPETIENLKSEKLSIDRELLQDIEFEEWQQILSSAIAEANSCAMLFSENFSYLAGATADRKIVKSLYEYFEKLCSDLCKKELSVMRSTGFGTIRTGLIYIPTHHRIAPEDSASYRESYLNGLATAIGTRLLKQSDQAKADARRRSVESTALVIVENKMVKTMEFVQENFDIEEIDQTVKIEDRTGFNAGVFAGQTIALTNKILDEGESESDNDMGNPQSPYPKGWTHLLSYDWATSKINDVGYENFMSEYQGKIVIDDVDDEC